MVGVSERDKKILELAATGITNKEISDKVFMRVRSVDGRMQYLFGRFNASNKIELVLKAIAQGVISNPFALHERPVF